MPQTETLTSTAVDAASKRLTFTELGGGAIGLAAWKAGIRDSLVILTDASAGSYTLQAPTAGIDDGKEVTFVAQLGQAYVITTPTNAINGNKHIATFGGTLGQQAKLVAQGGIWYTNPSVTGITLS